MRINYQDYRRDLLHFIYGVGSYQGALNHPTPILVTTKPDDNAYPVVMYYKPLPGTLNDAQAIKTASDTPSRIEAVKKGCESDGLVVLGDDFSEESGSHTLGLFVSERGNVCFARHVGDKWHLKNEMFPTLAFENTSLLESSTGTKFESFLQAKDGVVPKTMSALTLKYLSLQTENGGNCIVHEIVPTETLPFEKLVWGGFFAANVNKRSFFKLDYDWKPLENYPLPMPALQDPAQQATIYDFDTEKFAIKKKEEPQRPQEDWVQPPPRKGKNFADIGYG